MDQLFEEELCQFEAIDLHVEAVRMVHDRGGRVRLDLVAMVAV
jgi:hypothetical protein